MDFKTQGDAIVKRIQKAWAGFQQTNKPGRVYNEEEIKIKSKWVKKIEAANYEWREWLNSIPKKPR